jgi:hypothetical protein
MKSRDTSGQSRNRVGGWDRKECSRRRLSVGISSCGLDVQGSRRGHGRGGISELV